MGFFDRLKNGWELAKVSLRTINENRELLLFPVFSTISLILILATFFGGTYFLIGDSIEGILDNENGFLGEFSGGQKKSPESVKKVTFRLWNQISYMSYC
jgi:hypothetical protein